MPSIMGEFATGKFWTIGGPLVSLVVIAINIYFTVDIISGYESTAAYVIVSIIGLVYAGNFLIFMI